MAACHPTSVDVVLSLLLRLLLSLANRSPSLVPTRREEQGCGCCWWLDPGRACCGLEEKQDEQGQMAGMVVAWGFA